MTFVRIYPYTDFAIEIWGFYRRLTDTLRYHYTRCSRASGLQLAAILQMFTNGRKVEFNRSCPLFLASFGKLRLSDQVQFIAWHGIQRRIIWIFCQESEVSTVKPLYSEQSRDPKKCSLYRGVHPRGVRYVHVHMCLQYTKNGSVLASKVIIRW